AGWRYRSVPTGAGTRLGMMAAAGTSAAVRTAWTPALSRARLASIRTSRAWACGERRTAAWSMPGTLTSSTNRPRPVTKRSAPRRRCDSPIIAGLYAGATKAIGHDGFMRILLVDDSSPHRRLLTALFARSGHETLTATDGAAALGTLEKDQGIDAVVSDVRMPKIDGFQLCRTIRNDPRWVKLPFIFYSGIFTGDPAKTFGRDLGATAYLDAKDISPNEVAKEL